MSTNTIVERDELGWKGWPSMHLCDSGSEVVAFAAGNEDPDGAPETVCWFHYGYANLSSYAAALLRLREDPVNLPVAVAHRHIALRTG